MTTSWEDRFESTWRDIADVSGWMTYDQGRWLDRAAGHCPPGGRIVEIGSFHGRSTIVLARAAATDCEVVAIDPHAGNDRGPQEIEGFEAEASEDHRRFLANLTQAGVADRVRHVRRPSHEAHGDVTGTIDVLYVDGAHRFAPARRDLVEWGGRVRPGGTMLIHDAFSSVGVTAAVMVALAPSAQWRFVGRTRSLARFDADLAPGWQARLVNAARLAAQLAWFTGNVLLKIALTLGWGRLMRRLGRREPEWPY